VRGGTLDVDSGLLRIGKAPAVFQIVDRLRAIPLVANEAASFERVDELLRLELGASEDLYDRAAKGALASDVPDRRSTPEARGQLAHQRVQVKVFGNRHLSFVSCCAGQGNAAAPSSVSECTGISSTES
jgi:hypothetical protein